MNKTLINLDTPIIQPGSPDLEWGECSKEEMTWEEGKKWCEDHGDGWRMPARWELVRAQEEKIKGFDDSAVYWSATEFSATSAWGVALAHGYTYFNTKTTTYYIRCVRPVIR